MKRLTLILLLLLPTFLALGQSENKYLRKGNSNYNNSNYAEAEVEYKKALEENTNRVDGHFNLGGALHQQSRHEEARKEFEYASVAINSSNEDRSKAFHNIGNSFLDEKKYKEAVDAYKAALRLNSSAENSRYNLSYALEMIQNQQQSDQDQEQDKDQEKKDEEKKEDQEKKDGSDGDEKKDEQGDEKEQKPSDKKEEGQDQEKGGKPEPKEISKEEAERILQAIKEQEQQIQKKLLKKEPGKKVKVEKEW